MVMERGDIPEGLLLDTETGLYYRKGDETERKLSEMKKVLSDARLALDIGGEKDPYKDVKSIEELSEGLESGTLPEFPNELSRSIYFDARFPLPKVDVSGIEHAGEPRYIPMPLSNLVDLE